MKSGKFAHGWRFWALALALAHLCFRAGEMVIPSGHVCCCCVRGRGLGKCAIKAAFFLPSSYGGGAAGGAGGAGGGGGGAGWSGFHHGDGGRRADQITLVLFPDYRLNVAVRCSVA